METSISSVAEIFKALSDENRLRILKLIAGLGNRLCVGMIAHKIGITQPAVSQHLKILKNAGLVDSSRQGFHMHYSVRNDSMDAFGITTIDFLKSFGTEFDVENECDLKGATEECNKLQNSENG